MNKNTGVCAAISSAEYSQFGALVITSKSDSQENQGQAKRGKVDEPPPCIHPDTSILVTCAYWHRTRVFYVQSAYHRLAQIYEVAWSSIDATLPYSTFFGIQTTRNI